MCAQFFMIIHICYLLFQIARTPCAPCLNTSELLDRMVRNINLNHVNIFLCYIRNEYYFNRIYAYLQTFL